MNPTRHVELDIDIGADAKDWSAIQAGEKLKPVETELRRIEELVGEVVSEMEYLRTREQKLRDTNESTNERVKWFAFGTMGMLVGLGAWQIVYLRAYFRCVANGLVRRWRSTADTSEQVEAPYLEKRWTFTRISRDDESDAGFSGIGHVYKRPPLYNSFQRPHSPISSLSRLEVSSCVWGRLLCATRPCRAP